MLADACRQGSKLPSLPPSTVPPLDPKNRTPSRSDLQGFRPPTVPLLNRKIVTPSVAVLKAGRSEHAQGRRPNPSPSTDGNHLSEIGQRAFIFGGTVEAAKDDFHSALNQALKLRF